jgi:hypothetical protein
MSPESWKFLEVISEVFGIHWTLLKIAQRCKMGLVCTKCFQTYQTQPIKNIYIYVYLLFQKCKQRPFRPTLDGMLKVIVCNVLQIYGQEGFTFGGKPGLEASLELTCTLMTTKYCCNIADLLQSVLRQLLSLFLWNGLDKPRFSGTLRHALLELLQVLPDSASRDPPTTTTAHNLHYLTLTLHTYDCIRSILGYIMIYFDHFGRLENVGESWRVDW